MGDARAASPTRTTASQPSDPIWPSSEVLEWLRINDFDEYVPLFQGNHIHGLAFTQLTHEKLRQIGIPTVRDRARLLNASRKTLSRPEATARSGRRPIPHTVTELGVRIPERGAIPVFIEAGYHSDSSYNHSNTSSTQSPNPLGSTSGNALPPPTPPLLTSPKSRQPASSAPISPLSMESPRSPLNNRSPRVGPEASPNPSPGTESPVGAPWATGGLFAHDMPGRSQTGNPVAPPSGWPPPPHGPRSAPIPHPDPQWRPRQRESMLPLPSTPLRLHSQFTKGGSRAQYGGPPTRLASRRVGELNHIDIGQQSRPVSTFSSSELPDRLPPGPAHSLSSDHLPLNPSPKPLSAGIVAPARRNGVAPPAPGSRTKLSDDQLIAGNMPMPSILDEFAIYPRSSSLNYVHTHDPADGAYSVVVPPRESSAARTKPGPATGSSPRLVPGEPPLPHTPSARNLTVSTRLRPTGLASNSSGTSLTLAPCSHSPYYNTWAGRSGSPVLPPTGKPPIGNSQSGTGSGSGGGGGGGGFFSTLFKPFSTNSRRKSLYGVTGGREGGSESKGSPSQTFLDPGAAPLPTSPALSAHQPGRPLIFSVQVKLESDERYAIIEISSATNGAVIRERLCQALAVDPNAENYTIWTVPPLPADQRGTDPIGEGPLSDDEIWNISQQANSIDAPNVRFVLSLTRTPSHAFPTSLVPPNIGKQANMVSRTYGRSSPLCRSPLEADDPRLGGATATRVADLPPYPDDIFSSFKVPRGRPPYSPGASDPNRLSDCGSDTSDTGAVVSFERSSRWDYLAGLARGDDPISLSELSMQELQRLGAHAHEHIPPDLARPPSYAFRSSHSSISSISPGSRSPPAGHHPRPQRLSTSSVSSVQSAREVAIVAAATSTPSLASEGKKPATGSKPSRRLGGFLTIDTKAALSKEVNRAMGSQRYSGSLASPHNAFLSQSTSHPSSPATRTSSNHLSPGNRADDSTPLASRESPMSPQAWNVLFPSNHVMNNDSTGSGGAKNVSSATELWHTPMQRPAADNTTPGASPALAPLTASSSHATPLDKSTELWSKPPVASTSSTTPTTSSATSKAALDAAFQLARQGAARQDPPPSVSKDTAVSPIEATKRTSMAQPRPSMESNSSSCSVYYDASEAQGRAEFPFEKSNMCSSQPGTPPLGASSVGRLPKPPEGLLPHALSPARRQLELRHSRSNSDTSRRSFIRLHNRTPSDSSTSSRARSRTGVLLTSEQVSAALALGRANSPASASRNRGPPSQSDTHTPHSRVSSISSQLTVDSQWESSSVQSWNQRPSTKLIINNLDLFFPHHDLDQPIIEPLTEMAEPFTEPSPQASPAIVPITIGLGLQMFPETTSPIPVSVPLALESDAYPRTAPASPPNHAGSFESPIRTLRDSAVPLPRLDGDILTSRKRSVRFVVQQAQRRRTLLEQQLIFRSNSVRSQAGPYPELGAGPL
ncbi:hypothetical protein BJ085DRAFT_34973, partial [Dimargaris cristalligena]